jgi:carboxypeptidase family protein
MPVSGRFAMETAAPIVTAPRSKSVATFKSKSGPSAPCRREVFLAGIVGAFAPQALRWYVDVNSSALKGSWDWIEIGGRLAVSALFLVIAGYVATLWEVRSLREAFMIGLGVPAIILGPGADLAALGKAQPAHGQTAYSVGVVEVRATSEGTSVPNVQIEASRDGRRHIADAGRLTLTPGTYRLEIRAPGYELETRQVTVTADNTTRVDISLRPLSAAQRFIKGASDAFRR